MITREVSGVMPVLAGVTPGLVIGFIVGLATGGRPEAAMLGFIVTDAIVVLTLVLFTRTMRSRGL